MKVTCEFPFTGIDDLLRNERVMLIKVDTSGSFAQSTALDMFFQGNQVAVIWIHRCYKINPWYVIFD